MLREDVVQRTPHSLRNADGVITYDPEGVANIFFDYFYKLYYLPDTLPIDLQARHLLLSELLSSWELPKLSEEAIDFLNAPIVVEEVNEVLKSLPSGKSPCPDGLTYLYY